MSDSIRRGDYVPTADQRLVMRVDWNGFEALLAVRGDRLRPRIAYLDGVVELMGESKDHARITGRIGDMAKAHMEETGIEFEPVGSWLVKHREQEAGVEPDESFMFGTIDKPRPDLAIEVIWTSGSIDKLEIYRRLGIPEVWFWEDGKLTAYVLAGTQYERRARSACLPDLDLDLVARLVDVMPRSEAIRQIREAARQGSLASQ